MLIVVSYDIPDQRRRTKVAKLLEGAGSRVLESVFELDLTPQQWAKLRARLGKKLNPAEDKARAYLLCQTCGARTEIVGGGTVESSPSTYII